MQPGVILLIVLVFAAAVTGQTKKQNGEVCNDNVDCLAGSTCQDHQGTKKCTAGMALYGLCASNQCKTGGNMTCTVGTGNLVGTCSCDDTHYAGQNDETCQYGPRKAANAPCKNLPFECIAGTTCLAKSPGSTEMVCKKKGELYSTCEAQSDCAKTNSNLDCTNNLCVCNLEYYPPTEDTGVCSEKRKGYMDECDDTRECVVNYKCKDFGVTDKCVPNYDAGGASFLQASVGVVVVAVLAHAWPLW